MDNPDTKSSSEPSIKEAFATIEQLKKKLNSTEKKLEKSEHERNEYRKLYELVHLELERIRRHLFGKKSERVADEQMALSFLEIAEQLKGLEAEDAAPLPNNSRKKGKGKNNSKPHGRQKLPEHLPLERIELPLPFEIEENPDDYKKIGEDVSETLERRPATLVRVQIVRPKYAKKGDDSAGVIAADLPTKPMEKGMAGPGLLAHVIIRKYLDQLPLNRQEGIFAREKIVLGRSTLCGWIKQCANLVRRLYDAMVKDSMNAFCIATDATGVLVQAPKQCIRGHFYVMIAYRDHLIYAYKRHNDGETVRELLGN